MIAGITVLLALVARGECLAYGNPCPDYCSCTIFASFHRVNCSHAALKDLPQNLHYDTTTLIFNDNRLRFLRNKTFENHSKLLQLYLNHNRISSLEVATFWKLHDLRTLILDHNLLEQIPQDAFVNNSQLVWLDLSGNMLLIPESGGLFKSLSVTRLMLADCGINYLPPDMFVTTLKLEKLDLANNSIESVSLVTFEPLAELLYLDFSGNNLNCNCDIVPFHSWTVRRNLKIEAECSDGFWVRVGNQNCPSVSLFTWVGVGVGVLFLLVLVVVLTYYMHRRRKLSPVQMRRRPPLPSLPAGTTGEYIEVVAEKTYESIRETEVARYMASPTSSPSPPDTSDGPVYVNSFVAPKSRRDRVPTYDDVRPPSPTVSAAKLDAKARCMSLASILKDCDYYETVD